MRVPCKHMYISSSFTDATDVKAPCEHQFVVHGTVKQHRPSQTQGNKQPGLQQNQ